MEFAGEISTIGLREVFENIAYRSLSGVLTITEREHAARLYFETGTLRAFCPGPGRPFDYGAIAEASGAAGAGAIDEARSRRRRRSLRTALLEVEGFQPQRFDAGVSEAIEEEVISLFGWEEASFVFDEDPPPMGTFDREQLEADIAIDPKALSLAASLRRDAWRDVANRIGSESEVFVAYEPADRSRLPRHGETVLPVLDGTRDLRAVVEEIPLTRFQVLSTVAKLIEMGIVRHATVEQLCELASSSQEAGNINRAAQYLTAARKQDPEDLHIRWELVHLYERAGRPTEAAREYKELGGTMEARGDVAGALAAFERAAELAPYDADTLERIASIHDARGERAEQHRALRRLAQALAARGHHERALQVYEGMLPLSTGEEARAVRESMATLYIKLHEPAKAVRELLQLAQRSVSDGALDRALRYYRAASAVDRNCEEATTGIREIESGNLLARSRKRRRIAVAVALTLAVGLFLGQLAREASAHEALHHAARATVSGLSQDPADRILVAAISQYSQIHHDHPFTLGARRAKEMVRALVLEELQQVEVLMEWDPDGADYALRRLGRVRMPADVRELWTEARDDMLRRIAETRTAIAAAGR